ncbi:hypothetical protein [Zavarzinia sp.]|uniref:hypothetical protein n=1 Tax=Zavarzinia sp. TaxID=2027920 RepID=UPI00356371B8
MQLQIQIIDDATGETVDTCTLAEFLAANVDDDDVCDAARGLKVGESTLIGGGAAPLVRLVGIGGKAVPSDAIRRKIEDARWRAQRHLYRGSEARERGDEAMARWHDERGQKWLDLMNKLEGNG